MTPGELISGISVRGIPVTGRFIKTLKHSVIVETADKYRHMIPTKQLGIKGDAKTYSSGSYTEQASRTWNAKKRNDAADRKRKSAKKQQAEPRPKPVPRPKRKYDSKMRQIDADAIKSELKRRGMYYRDLAKASGIGMGTIQKAVLEKKASPNTIAHIATALGMPVSEVMLGVTDAS